MNEELKKALQEVRDTDTSDFETILDKPTEIPNFRLLALLLLPVPDKDYKIISSKLPEAESKVLEALKGDDVSKLNELVNSPDISNALLIKAISLEKWNIATELLNKQTIGLDYQDMDGNTALHFAARCDNAIMIKRLIDHGIDVRKRNSQGETALDIAVDNMDTVLAILDSCQKKGILIPQSAEYRSKDLNIRKIASNGSKMQWAIESGLVDLIGMIFTPFTRQNHTNYFYNIFLQTG
jgi:ankyrin repeat protein